MYRSDTEQNPESLNRQASAWVQEIASTGRVIIGVSNRKVITTFAIPIAIASAVFGFAYLTGEMDLGPMIMGVVLTTLIFAGIIMFISRKFGGSDLILEDSGFTTFEGVFIPWDQVELADIFKSSRSAPAVRILVTEPAWQQYLSKQTAPGRMVNRLNTAVTRKRGIYLPTHVEADNDALVELINFFAKGQAAR